MLTTMLQIPASHLIPRPRYLYTHVSVPRNLGICAISRLRSAFSESRNCVPISRLRKQSSDCAIRLRNLEIAQTYCTIFELLTLAMCLTASALTGRKPFIQAVSCSRRDIMRSTTVSDVVYRSAAGRILRDFVSDSGRMASKPARP